MVAARAGAVHGLHVPVQQCAGVGEWAMERTDADRGGDWYFQDPAAAAAAAAAAAVVVLATGAVIVTVTVIMIVVCDVMVNSCNGSGLRS